MSNSFGTPGGKSVIEILSPNPYSSSNEYLDSAEQRVTNTAPEGLTLGSELSGGSRQMSYFEFGVEINP